MTPTLNCDLFNQSINALLDGEAAPELEGQLRDHMAQCHECAQKYKELSALRQMLGRMDDDLEIPVEFERGWRSAIRAERRNIRLRRVTRAVAGVAAAFVLLTGATVYNRQSGRLGTRESVAETALYAVQDAADMDAGAAYNVVTAADDDAPDIIEYESTGAAASIESGDFTLSAAIDDGYTASAEAAKRSYYADMEDAADQVEALDGVYDYSGLTGALTAGSDDLSGLTIDTTSRVLRSASLTIETDQFDDDMQTIKRTLATYGGLFERNMINGDTGSRRAELRMRVPAGFLESFVEQMRAVGHVVSSEVSAQDITSQYTDTALRLDTYRAQLKRVKELTAQAADLKEILELEQEASRLQYEIDTLTGALNGWDSQSEMSTVNVTLNEYTSVNAAFSADGFKTQVSDRFTESMNNVADFFRDMALTVADLAPHLIWFAPLCAACILIMHYLRRRKYAN